MATIEMGLNTEPDYLKADVVIARWKRDGNQQMVEYWEKARVRTLELRNLIIDTVETDGWCYLNWSCNGATRFNMHACQWADALPMYRFEIGRYLCKVCKD